jgi:hypothetical protein
VEGTNGRVSSALRTILSGYLPYAARRHAAPSCSTCSGPVFGQTQPIVQLQRATSATSDPGIIRTRHFPSIAVLTPDDALERRATPESRTTPHNLP